MRAAARSASIETRGIDAPGANHAYSAARVAGELGPKVRPGPHQPRRDRGRRDPGSGELGAQAVREPHGGELGRAVRQQVRHADQPADRRDDAEPTTAARPHPGDQGQGQVDRTPLHGADRLLEVRAGQRGERPDLDDTGDVDGDLDRTELVLHPRQLLLDEVGVADVADHRAGVDALVGQGEHGAVQLLGVPRPQHGQEAAPAELASDEQAEAA